MHSRSSLPLINISFHVFSAAILIHVHFLFTWQLFRLPVTEFVEVYGPLLAAKVHNDLRSVTTHSTFMTVDDVAYLIESDIQDRMLDNIVCKINIL